MGEPSRDLRHDGKTAAAASETRSKQVKRQRKKQCTKSSFSTASLMYVILFTGGLLSVNLIYESTRSSIFPEPISWEHLNVSVIEQPRPASLGEPSPAQAQQLKDRLAPNAARRVQLKTSSELMECGIHKSCPFFNITDLEYSDAASSGGARNMIAQHDVEHPLRKAPRHRPLRVGLGTALPMQGESIHIMYDGIASSNFMELVQFCNLVSKNDPEFIDKKKPEQVNPIQEYLHHRSNCTVHNETHVELWVLDVIRARSQKEFRKNSFLQQLWFDGINAKWKLLLVEYSDRFFVNVFYNKILLHDNITDKSVQQNIQDKPHIRTATRMIIKGRQYNSTSKKLEIGRLEMPEQANTAGGPTKHAPYTVRTDHVNSLKRVLSDMLSDAKKKAGTALHDAFRGADDPAKHWDAMRYARDRPLDESCLPPPYSRVREEFDVAHFWPIINSGYGSYRNDVTRTVMKLHGQPRRDAPHITIRAKTSTSGPTGRTGRTTASLDYARACLSTKIIVTTGRDAWEDHYRLMEGLAAGAMVLSDVMLSLPKGLENGTSVVFFEDVQDLHQKIEYYLEHDEERQAIAKRGWEVSMGYHRSYHRMEELVFGCPLTLVNVPYEEMCPSGNSAYTIN